MHLKQLIVPAFLFAAATIAAVPLGAAEDAGGTQAPASVAAPAPSEDAAAPAASLAHEGASSGLQIPAEHQILIIPAEKLLREEVPPTVPAGVSGDAPSSVIVIDRDAYNRIYRTIPFNRAEYRANPSYRHDSTMEILTGNARHQTIVKHTTVKPQPATTPVTAPVIPYRYNNWSRGLNYYFYFPYWNARGFYGSL